MDWMFHKPTFQYEKENPRMMVESAWRGHRFFAYDLVCNMKPQNIVELGTHWGLSFFSFCQAVVDTGLSTKCFAIDTWKGDGHSGLYPEDVFNSVFQITQKHYNSTAVLIRSTFDDALAHFPDNSIDILHIDGFHTYDAVKHDYQTWYRKVAEQGVVLFHDIHERHMDFGVYKLWEKLKHYPHMEFDHFHGLGVLFPKGCPPQCQELIKRHNNFKSIYQQ